MNEIIFINFIVFKYLIAYSFSYKLFFDLLIYNNNKGKLIFYKDC